MLTADPFDAEVQQKIAEEIRLDRVSSGHMLMSFCCGIYLAGSVRETSKFNFVRSGQFLAKY